MKFKLKNYKGKFVMLVKTEEEAKVFCKFLNANGRRWNNASSYLDFTHWGRYKNKTVYYFNKCTYGSIDGKALTQDYTILEFSDFNWDVEKYIQGEN